MPKARILATLACVVCRGGPGWGIVTELKSMARTTGSPLARRISGAPLYLALRWAFLEFGGSRRGFWFRGGLWSVIVN
jgi:hypothetical protein